MTGFKRTEGYFKGYKDTQIFFQTWTVAQPRLTVLITHGLGEHSECYQRLIDSFKDGNFNFVAWDMRGHGRSEGKRGFVQSFNDYVYDFEILLQQLRTKVGIKEPLVLLAHSLGGLVQSKYLTQNSDNSFCAQVLSAPLVGFALPVPMIKDRAARLLNLIMPQFTMWDEITYDMLTRDPEVKKEFEKDHLRHDLISSGLYLGMIENMKVVHELASKITLPTLVQVSQKDPVVSTSEVKRFFEKLGSDKKRILFYGDGSCHEIYNDIHRGDVYKDLNKFLEGLLK